MINIMPVYTYNRNFGKKIKNKQCLNLFEIGRCAGTAAPSGTASCVCRAGAGDPPASTAGPGCHGDGPVAWGTCAAAAEWSGTATPSSGEPVCLSPFDPTATGWDVFSSKILN